jgi:hypothetical protein
MKSLVSVEVGFFKCEFKMFMIKHVQCKYVFFFIADYTSSRCN